MNSVKLLQVQGPVIGTVSKNDSYLKQTKKGYESLLISHCIIETSGPWFCWL